MKNNLSLKFENFEKISNSQENNLIGGFSQSYTHKKDKFVVGPVDNCDGGNCTYGCNANVNCNTVAGCGAK